MNILRNSYKELTRLASEHEILGSLQGGDTNPCRVISTRVSGIKASCNYVLLRNAVFIWDYQ